MLVYIEYISRRSGVDLAEFHYAAGLQDTWTEDHGEDVLLLSMGRTFRTGPDPWYSAVWYTPDGGLERIGDWERTFDAHEADALEIPFKLGAQIDKAGCYEPLLEPVLLPQRPVLRGVLRLLRRRDPRRCAAVLRGAARPARGHRARSRCATGSATSARIRGARRLERR